MNMTTLPQLPLHRLHIHRRIDIAMSPNIMGTIGILLLSAASRSRLSAGNVIVGGELANGGPRDGRFDSEDIGSCFDAEEAHFALCKKERELFCTTRIRCVPKHV